MRVFYVVISIAEKRNSNIYFQTTLWLVHFKENRVKHLKKKKKIVDFPPFSFLLIECKYILDEGTLLICLLKKLRTNKRSPNLSDANESKFVFIEVSRKFKFFNSGSTISQTRYYIMVSKNHIQN